MNDVLAPLLGYASFIVFASVFDSSGIVTVHVLLLVTLLAVNVFLSLESVHPVPETVAFVKS